MFKVAFVGDRLLSNDKFLSRITEWQFASKHFHFWCEKHKIPKWNTEEKMEIVKLAFFLAALFHDFGYGYSFLRTYKGRLHKLYEWLLPEADSADINTQGTQTLLQSLPARFVAKHHAWLLRSENDKTHKRKNERKVRNILVAGFFRDCIPLNHSVASSFFVLDIAEQLRNSRALTQKLYVAFQLAAEACMIHDMTDENNWAHLQKTKSEHFLDCDSHKSVPLAMLLILADELAVWKRPSLKIKQNVVKDVVEDRVYKVFHQLDRSKVPEKIDVSITGGKTRDEAKIKITVDSNRERIRRRFYEDLKCLRSDREQKHPRIFGYTINIMSP
jgi:hypothetical protein